jgi:MFS family permease
LTRRQAVLTACFSTVFISYAVRYGYGILLPKMLPALHISKAEAGAIYASFFIAYTVASPVLGLLGDRFNIRVILSLFVALFGAGTLLMAMSSSIVQASLFFALAGIGSAACWAPTMALAQRWTSAKRKGRTLAFVDIGSAMGIIGTSIVIPWVAGTFDWQAGWLTLGAIALCVALLNSAAIRNPPSVMAPPGPAAGRPGSRFTGSLYLELLKNRRFWTIGLAYLLTGFAIIVPFTFLSTYAGQELSFSYEISTRLIAIIGAGAIIGKITLGPLSDAIGRLRVMMMCAALITGGSLGMAFAKGPLLVAVIALFSLGYGGAWSMYAAAASDYFSREYSGSVIGLWTMYLGAGSVIAPVISGWLADATGTLRWAFVLAAGAGFVSLLMLLPLWRVSPAPDVRQAPPPPADDSGTPPGGTSPPVVNADADVLP